MPLITLQLWNFCTPHGWIDHEEFLRVQYLSGTSSIELGRIMGISHPVIRRKLKALGVTIRPRGCCINRPEIRQQISESLRRHYATRG